MPRRLHPRGVLLVTAACLVALAATVMLLGAFPADVAVREALLAVATPPVLRFMHVVNRAGAWRVLLPGTLLLFVVFPRARARWWLWPALMIVAPLCEWALKQVVGRPRPEHASLSFPSGHATAAAAFFGAVMYLAGSLPPRWSGPIRVAAGVMVVLVGLARVMLRAHWPSDVLGGFALGLLLASLAVLLDARARPAAA